MSKMTWRCDICHRERLDAFIDVAHRPLRGLEDGFPDTRFNLKFCNDSPDRIAKAHDPGPWPPNGEA
jgi:hypothetical protein